MSDSASTADRLGVAYKRLAASAAEFTAASNSFTRPILQIESALRQLDVDVTAWFETAGAEDDDGSGDYWAREIGFAPVDGRWRLAIRSTTGNHRNVFHDSVTISAFENALTSHKIEAFEKLPELIDEIVKNADKTSKKLREKTPDAKALAEAMDKANAELKAERAERAAARFAERKKGQA